MASTVPVAATLGILAYWNQKLSFMTNCVEVEVF